MSKQLIPILFLLISFTGFAQRNGEIQEKIKAQKIAFITDKLELTSEEAQQFWPIYNEFEDKVEKIKSEDLRPLKIEMRQGNVSDKRANEILEKLIKAEDEMHNAKQELIVDLKKVLPAKKIIMLQVAEDQFNQKLLDKLKDFRERRQNRRN
ncbi:sensor of ECF-type sigma factor [Winogradskyella sp. HB-48]|uniref:sensor of ECF-type sigma factor n=1 Tax=Winogradskyella sp. HB-48 TaxID=3416808 RepID=UPI003CF4299C